MSKVATKDGSFRLRVATEKLESWREAARSENVSLSQWVTEACDAARADVYAIRDKAVQDKLERLEMIAKATPQILRASALPSKRSYRPDPK